MVSWYVLTFFDFSGDAAAPARLHRLIQWFSIDAEGAKIADVELVNTASITSSKEPVPLVRSPTYAELRN